MVSNAFSSNEGVPSKAYRLALAALVTDKSQLNAEVELLKALSPKSH